MKLERYCNLKDGEKVNIFCTRHLDDYIYDFKVVREFDWPIAIYGRFDVRKRDQIEQYFEAVAAIRHKYTLKYILWGNICCYHYDFTRYVYECAPGYIRPYLKRILNDPRY